MPVKADIAEFADDHIQDACVADNNCSVKVLCCTLCHPQAKCGHTATMLQLTCRNQLLVLPGLLPEAAAADFLEVCCRLCLHRPVPALVP